MSRGVLIKGRSIAAMVCADVLARAGVPVQLQTTGPLGRSFAPISIGGRKLELGPRLIELSYGGEDEAFADLNPRYYTQGLHRLHMAWIAAYIDGLLEAPLVPAELLMSYRQDLGPEFLLTGDLASLRRFCSAKEAKHIEADAMLAMVGYPFGMTREQLGRLTYREASLMLHGESFHQLFMAPILDQMLGRHNDVPALQHRAVWMPLFRPIEVVQAARGESSRPHRQMFFGMGEVTERLIARVLPLTSSRVSNPEWVVCDVAPSKGQVLPVTFVWTDVDAEDAVCWMYGAPGWRWSQHNGVRCTEYRGDFRQSGGEAIAAIRVDVPIGPPSPINPRSGTIGTGSFNENIAAGLCAAAWRIPRTEGELRDILN